MSERGLKSTWKDISSYSRTDTNREPHSFQIWIGPVRLVVTRKLHLEGWYVDAPPFIISRRTESEKIEGAKQEALMTLESELERALNAVRSA